MRERISQTFSLDSKIVLDIPFFPPIGEANKNIRHEATNLGNRFAYISDFYPHKNHLNLFKAWGILAEKFGFHPELVCTINPGTKKVNDGIQAAHRHNAQIACIGSISRREVSELLAKCNWVIFPSVSESLGLGLIEGIESGCGALCSDLPWASDVAKGQITFNPLSADSIASAVLQTKSKRPAKCTLKINDRVSELISLLL
jgi:glycosyltransferase involved in cell wall biosynthesis